MKIHIISAAFVAIITSLSMTTTEQISSCLFVYLFERTPAEILEKKTWFRANRVFSFLSWQLTKSSAC